MTTFTPHFSSVERDHKWSGEMNGAAESKPGAGVLLNNGGHRREEYNETIEPVDQPTSDP